MTCLVSLLEITVFGSVGWVPRFHPVGVAPLVPRALQHHQTTTRQGRRSVGIKQYCIVTAYVSMLGKVCYACAGPSRRGPPELGRSPCRALLGFRGLPGGEALRTRGQVGLQGRARACKGSLEHLMRPNPRPFQSSQLVAVLYVV